MSAHQGPLGQNLIYLEPDGGRLAIRGGRVFPATGSVTLAPATVVVEGERITAVGRDRDVPIPDGCRVIDARGKFVMPGLIDLHVHFTGVFTSDPYRRFLQPPFAARVIRAALDASEVLAAGFTTVRELGHGSMDQVIGLRHAINHRLIAGPRILTSGWAISQTGGHGDPNVFPREWTRQLRPRSTFADGADECRRVVRENFGAGADLVKIYATERGLGPGPDGLRAVPNFTIPEIEAMTDEAHRRGAKVAAHATSPEGIRNAILGGVDTIEHGGDIGAHDDLLDLMVERGVFLVPTLSVYYWIASEGAAVKTESRAISGSRAMMDVQARYLAKVHRHGVRIALGTDTGNIRGRGENARELEMMVEYGLSPLDALLAGTRVGAEAMGLQDHLGTLEAGKLGDMLILAADPLQDIACVRRKENIVHIIKSRASLSRAPKAPA
ncbi:MAG: amidohydrolase family protein [Armatimonadetes bacterium]|nr:amidohydrolase family protein [Armatimonadota bacterium]